MGVTDIARLALRGAGIALAFSAAAAFAQEPIRIGAINPYSGQVALYGLFNVLVGWPCPLTHVENWGRARAGEATLPGTGFIDHYIAGVVYPKEHEALVQVLVALVVLTSWMGYLIRRRRTGVRLFSPRRAPAVRPRRPHAGRT